MRGEIAQLFPYPRHRRHRRTVPRRKSKGDKRLSHHETAGRLWYYETRNRNADFAGACAGVSLSSGKSGGRGAKWEIFDFKEEG